MAEVNYGRFDSNRFENFHSVNEDIDGLVQSGDKLTGEQKVVLGRELARLENRSVGRFFKSIASRLSRNRRDNYLTRRADTFIKIKNRQKIENLKEQGLTFGQNLEDTLRDMAELRTGSQEKFYELLSVLSSLSLAGSEKVSEGKSPTEEKVENVAQQVVTFSSIEAHKAKSNESQKNMMETLFHLNVVPDAPKETVRISGFDYNPATLTSIYEDNNTQKKALMAEHLPLDKASEISAQARKYPVMQAAVQKIRQNLEQWDDLALRLDTQGLKELKEELAQQFKGLSALSDVVSSVTTSEEDSAALVLVQPKSFQKQNVQVLSLIDSLVDNYLSGKADLQSENSKQFCAGVLKQFIENAKADLPEPTAKAEVEQRRQQAPVTTKAIQLQAELHKAIRQGKAWAMQQPSLTAQGASANEVFKLDSPERESGAAAFFKVGAGGEEAAGTMEKMMWDISVVMGLEEMFVPTGQAEVRAAGELEGGTEKVKVWEEREGKSGTGEEIERPLELVEKEGAKKALRGGIQIAQEGVKLWEYQWEPDKRSKAQVPQVSKNEVVSAVGVSLVFGMFDAHAGNIFVTKEGKIKFFDNTKSLPNSNGFINQGGGLVSSYRCGLLDLPESHEQLTPGEIAQLKGEVAAYKGKIERLKEYLQTSHAQAQLEKLPPGWMNLETSIAAMEERVNLMDQALANNKVNTLQDLAIESNPSYKFAFALTFMDLAAKGKMDLNLPPAQVQQYIHAAVGKGLSNQQIDKLTSHGLDIEEVKSWCDNPNLSMEDMIKNIQTHYNNRVQNPIHIKGPEMQKIMQGARRIKQELYSKAAYDYKDRDRASCENITMNVNSDAFSANGVPCYNTPNIQNTIFWAANNNKAIHLAHSQTDGSLNVIYKTSTGYRAKKVDIHIKSNPGMVREVSFKTEKGKLKTVYGKVLI